MSLLRGPIWHDNTYNNAVIVEDHINHRWKLQQWGLYSEFQLWLTFYLNRHMLYHRTALKGQPTVYTIEVVRKSTQYPPRLTHLIYMQFTSIPFIIHHDILFRHHQKLWKLLLISRMSRKPHDSWVRCVLLSFLNSVHGYVDCSQKTILPTWIYLNPSMNKWLNLL